MDFFYKRYFYQFKKIFQTNISFLMFEILSITYFFIFHNILFYYLYRGALLLNTFKRAILPSALCLSLYLLNNSATEVIAVDSAIENREQATDNSPKADSLLQTITQSAPLTQELIPDPSLKEFILATLGKPAGSTLTQQELATLVSLYIPADISAQINSLSGLEYAVNLADFFLGSSNVVDFSPLEQLSSLKFVDLSGKNLTSANFPDLKKSSGIIRISASSAQLTNEVFPKLTQFAQLERLYLDSNMGITTIEPLKVLPKLRSISIQFCGVTDFTVINDFPALNDLAAFGQNIGRMDPVMTLTRSELVYTPEEETIFIPFSLMPSRLKNFDGYLPPFSLSTSASEMILKLNDIQLPSNRLLVTENGITVLNVQEDEYNDLATMYYNARINNPVGSYATPANLNFYSISSGTYLQTFSIIDDPIIRGTVTINFHDQKGTELAEPVVLSGNVGEPFTAQPKELSDWILFSSPEATEGTFTQAAQEMTFVYEKASGADVTVLYTDEDEQPIAPSETLSGKIGASYQTQPKQIDHYQWIQQIGPTEGTFTKQAQTIRYIYKKNELPNLPDSNNADVPTAAAPTQTSIANELIDLITSPVFVSGSTSPHIENTNERTVDSQNLSSLPDTLASFREPKSVPSKKSERKTNKSRDGVGSVTVKFVDENGNEIAKPNTLTGKIGETYKVTAKKNTPFKIEWPLAALTE